jgi:hypothetical protein
MTFSITRAAPSSSRANSSHSPGRSGRSTAALRITAGGLVGVCAWVAFAETLPFLPAAVRFLVAWLGFTFGAGVAAGGWLTRDLDDLRRVIVLLGVGTGATPVLVDVLGRLHLLPVYPYVALALAGAGLAAWTPPCSTRRSPISWTDIGACAALVALAVGLGAIVFWHRFIITRNGLVLYGDYDSMDLSFYAAWASESSHTVPPTASYYTGHQLNGAYYPQFVLAMVHRFADVPLLPIYFRYAWPAFLSLGALTAFVLVRSLAPVGTALLAVVLMLVGGDFSYLAAWLLPHTTGQWDYVIWPSNFLASTMEVLQFNTWGPTLPLFFTVLYATVRGLQTRMYGWVLTAGALLAVLFQFKPFPYAVIIAGLFGATVGSRRDLGAGRRFVATLGLGVLFATPFFYGIATLQNDERRSRLLFDSFLLPQRMLLKLDLTDAFATAARTIAPLVSLRRPVFLLLATLLFLAGGLGIRWLGVPGLWRAIRGDHQKDAAAWRLLGWSAIAGVAIPFVLVTDPYVDTPQFYIAGLYLFWIFAASGLASFARKHRTMGSLAIVMAVGATLPSSLHFLIRKWRDAERAPLAGLTRAEANIAGYLQTFDPETTVILHDRPTAPSLMAIVSARRVVLGWGRSYYAVGSDDRVREVDAFFSSADRSPSVALDTLRRYHVTHVIEHKQRDRIHPDVLARLQPLLGSSEIVLYAVPPPEP